MLEDSGQIDVIYTDLAFPHKMAYTEIATIYYVQLY